MVNDFFGISRENRLAGILPDVKNAPKKAFSGAVCLYLIC